MHILCACSCFLVPTDFIYKTQFKDYIVKNLKMGKVEHWTKCGTFWVQGLGHMFMKLALIGLSSHVKLDDSFWNLARWVTFHLLSCCLYVTLVDSVASIHFFDYFQPIFLASAGFLKDDLHPICEFFFFPVWATD